jgi:antitoxin (DNA-binding transcriptional repressor) of toxin-antitoxin stability system
MVSLAVSPVGSICFRSWVNTVFAGRVLLARIPTASYFDGSVIGTVIDQDGKAVAGATVYFTPVGRPMAYVVPHRETDGDGHFAIRGLSRGRYAISAAKVAEGYPEMTGAFFTGNHPLQEVTLGPARSTATVTVQLGPKAGRLTGTVADGRTSVPLNPCTEFRWVSDPGNSLGTGVPNGRFSELIPSNTGVLWKVSLDGYKPWYYPGTTDKSAATPLRLQPGQVRTIAIRLQPDPAGGKTGCGMPAATAIR